jgi:hypothetical protein
LLFSIVFSKNAIFLILWLVMRTQIIHAQKGKEIYKDGWLLLLQHKIVCVSLI